MVIEYFLLNVVCVRIYFNRNQSLFCVVTWSHIYCKATQKTCFYHVTIDVTTEMKYNINGKRGVVVMQISSRFTLAVHILDCIDTFKDEYKATSDFLASSTNVNPVIVRKILGQLKSAGLVEIARGSGGASIPKPLAEVTLLDVYKAVECVDNGELFHFHDNPNILCPVGRNIHLVLDDKLLQVQNAMEKELASITLEDIHKDTVKYISQEE